LNHVFSAGDPDKTDNIMLIDKDFCDNYHFNGPELMHKEIGHRIQIVLNGIGGGILITDLDPAFVI
jgi:hypothetical protein